MAFIGNTSTTQSFAPAIDYFNGDGTTVAFTLSRPVASVAQVQVVVNNVAQNPSSAYTVSGNTITFTSAPSSGTSNIYVYYTSPITQVIQPSQGTVGSSQIVAGAVGTTQIAVDAVTATQIAAGAVGSSEIAAGAVGATQLAATAALSNLYGLTYLPLFSGYRDAGNVSASNVVLHNTINVNTGSCYSSVTGRFTCPVAGNYEVSIGGHAENAQPVELTILKNGSSVQGEYSNGSAYGAVTCTTVLSCAANDYIQQRVTTGTFWGGNNSGLRMTVKLISV